MNVIEKPSLDDLLDDNLKNMIAALASSYYKSYQHNVHGSALITHEDLNAEGLMAITLAHQSFDPARGAFRTWAYPYINHAMNGYCLKYCHTLSISYKAARTDLHNMLNVGVVHIDQLEEGCEFDVPAGSGVGSIKEAEDYLFDGLGCFERQLVEDYLVHNLSLRQVAFRNKMSPSRAGNIIRRVTDGLKARMEEYVKNG